MITIVKVVKLDPAALSILRAESLKEGFQFIERLCAEWALGANQFDAAGAGLFLALFGDRVVGICGLSRDPYASDRRVGRVRHLYVLKALRRNGVGRALLNAVIGHAYGHFKVLRTRTEEADRFYVALGFSA